jgi:hypothetical protein
MVTTTLDHECPISSELMLFPVTTSCGHTFDKLSLLAWMENKPSVECPVCKNRTLFYGDIVRLEKNFKIAERIDYFILQSFDDRMDIDGHMVEEIGFSSRAAYCLAKTTHHNKIVSLCSKYTREQTDARESIVRCTYNFERYIYMLNVCKENQLDIQNRQFTELLDTIEHNRFVYEAVAKRCDESSVMIQYDKDVPYDTRTPTLYKNISICRRNNVLCCK